MIRDALDLWSDLERAGMTLSVTDGKLAVTPALLLTGDLRVRIRAALTDLFALVSAAPSPEQQAILDALLPFDFAGPLSWRLPPDPAPVPDEPLWIVRKMLHEKQSRMKFKEHKDVPEDGKTLFIRPEEPTP